MVLSTRSFFNHIVHRRKVERKNTRKIYKSPYYKDKDIKIFTEPFVWGDSQWWYFNLGSQENGTWDKGLYNNNSLESKTPGKQKWEERRNEGGKEVEKKSRRWTIELAPTRNKEYWLLSLRWHFHKGLGRSWHLGTRLGTEKGRRPGSHQWKVTAGDMNSPRLLNHATCLSRQLPGKPDPSTAVALSMHELSQQVKGSQQHFPTVHLQPAASSSVYHLCGNREAPERFFFKARDSRH